ncbi:DNA-repair protein UVH3, putative [[Leptolyngbya] sp. PCC 7376]|uniref:hypothetical protein n=1 Tax=[Leptolyngbya] sp. PCC 7376 TaxID=111781 RepID=UPI00029F2A28|nr:hypothetical protein [[Leptolyngbya] sp. PCC 7376]AFY40642.1 DNA-repair protein UVH3, putative [[Leptolyngbya] sp. PCC 7376]
MKKYTVGLEGLVVTEVSEIYTVEAETEEDALEKARQMMDDDYICDELDIQDGYAEEIDE